MWRDVRDREFGKLQPPSFAGRIRSRRLSSLELSNRKEIVSPHTGHINTLQVDLTEGRYLLSGSTDASAAVYDIQRATYYKGGGLVAHHKNLFVVDKTHENGHKFAISSAIWYPVDTGLFVTGSFDNYVKVWDTNMTQVVMDFKMPGKVHSVSMSSLAASHMLIAAGSEDVQVRLCDIASGAFTHTLSGHRDGIMSLEWSTSSEWTLISGGRDGAIRFWDIRRAGCFLVLDQSRSQLGRRPPFCKSTLKKGPATRTVLEGQSSSAKVIPSPKKTHVRSGMKQLPTVRKGRSLNGGSSVQRLHPGMISSQNRSTAHYGSVTGLKATRDGMYLLSSGSDSRLRLWDIESGCNTLVNFEAKHLQTLKSIQLAVADDSSLVFVPYMATIKAYDVWSGATFQTLRGHYDTVNSCCFGSQDQELYTGSQDRQILVWSPTSPFNLDMFMPGENLGLEAWQNMFENLKEFHFWPVFKRPPDPVAEPWQGEFTGSSLCSLLSFLGKCPSLEHLCVFGTYYLKAVDVESNFGTTDYEEPSDDEHDVQVWQGLQEVVLPHLKTFSFTEFSGKKEEMRLVQFLLARAAGIKSLCLHYVEEAERELDNIHREMETFPAISPVAEITFQNLVEDMVCAKHYHIWYHFIVL